MTKTEAPNVIPAKTEPQKTTDNQPEKTEPAKPADRPIGRINTSIFE